MALPAMTPTIREQLRPITFEEYRAMPDDGVRYELIDGALFEMPGRKKIHQYVVGELFVSLREFVRRKRSGIVLVAPFDVRLGPYTAVQPDLMYFSFVTLATLGYGDITPVTKAARTLAEIEALAGSLYMAVFMARLVSLVPAAKLPEEVEKTTSS